MQTTTNFCVMVAVDEKGGIGKDGGLAWRLSADIKRFKEITTEEDNSVVIMGRKTYESIPYNFRPLKNRINVVLTSNNEWQEDGVDRCNNLLSALYKYRGHKIFVIGGKRVFEEALSEPLVRSCEQIYLTRIEGDFNCDISLPNLEEQLKAHFTLDEEELFNNDDEELSFSFQTYVSNRIKFKDEYQYLDLIEEIIEHGVERKDRTGVGTKSIFGRTLRFDIRDHFPLLTTKKVFWRGVVEELLWFLMGQTNARTLASKGVKIWNGNSSRAFLDSIGLEEYDEGDCGPHYGFQWRHFGAIYRNCYTDYTDRGEDQIKNIINLIKEDPTSRRIILTGWNPPQLHQVVLPPCHLLYQWYVDVEKGELNCMVYLR